MTLELQSAQLQCPYCWESIEVLIDCSVEQQDYVEDCSVCCHPMVITASAEEGFLVDVYVRAEND